MKFTFCAKVIKAKETFLLFRICCQCKYGVKAIFNVFALLVIVVQTQSLTYVQVRSKQFQDSICYTCKSIISHSKFNNLTRHLLQQKSCRKCAAFHYICFGMWTLSKYGIYHLCFACKYNAIKKIASEQIWTKSIKCGIYFLFTTILLRL